MAYDQKCFDLAEIFLSDAGIASQGQIEALAQEIQGTVEAYIDNYEPTETEQGLIPIPKEYAEQ